MAGDVGLNERVIIQPKGAADVGQAPAAAVLESDGRVVHQYGDRLLIAEVPDGAVTDVEHVMEAAGVVTERVDDLPKAVTTGLGDDAKLGLAAFELRSSDAYEQAKATRPHAGASWDNDETLAPDAPQQLSEQVGALAGGPTSSRLTGSVAVAIIIVEGPDADLKFSFADRVKVIAEVQNGLGWLGAQSSPAGVKFVYQIE